MEETASTMTVEVRLFARLRELCDGHAALTMDLPSGADPEGCFAQLSERFPAARRMRPGLAVAVNEDYASWQDSLRDGDVVTFIPPVSGG